MRRLYQLILMSLIVALLAGCSLIKGGLEQMSNLEPSRADSADNQKNSAAELLAEATQAMEKMEGYRWESRVDQQGKMSSEIEEIEATFKYTVDYLDPKRYSMYIEGKMEAGNQRNNLDLKMIADGDIVYLYEPSMEWIQTREIPEQIIEMMELEYFDPQGLSKLLSPHMDKITVDQQEDHWQLTLNLKDHEAITPFMQYAIENHERNDRNADASLFPILKWFWRSIKQTTN